MSSILMDNMENIPSGGNSSAPMLVAVGLQVALFLAMLAAIVGLYAG
jgi:hypothetical protein